MRIVLADDHRIVRSGLRWALGEEEGIEIVGEAEDGEDLLAVLAEIPADIVVLDIRMPGMGGLEALPALRSQHPDIRVIIFSMHDEPAFIRAAIERGASGYLLKSAGTEELVRAIRAVAEGKSYVHSVLVPHVFAEVSGTSPEQPSEDGLEVLRLVADGLSTAAISERLGITEAAVKRRLLNTFDRLGVSTRAGAVAAALRRGLIE